MTTYTPTDVAYDYAIGGLPFLSSAGTKLTPYSSAVLNRQTAPYRKDQTDQSTEVGEQSLQFWWSRSQSSFHAGAGQAFLDGGDEDTFRKLRFDYSRNVDVWTAGAVSLLPTMIAANATHVGGYAVVAVSGGVAWSGTHGGVYGLWYTDGSTWTQITGYTGTLGGQHCSDGTYVYFQTDTGIWKVTPSAPASPSKLYVAATFLTVYYAKDRLLAVSADGRSIYELDTTAAAAALPTPLFTHPTLRYQGVAEGPTGIYIGLDNSAVHLISLTTVGGVPTLGVPTQMFELPAGETLTDNEWSLFSYLGKFLAVGTTRGVRIAKIATDGSLDLGPRLFEKDAAASEWIFGGFSAKDRFIYAVAVGQGPGQTDMHETCAFRIDLGTEIADGRYAWAQDMATGDTDLFPFSSCIDAAGRLWITGNSSFTSDLYVSTSSNYTAGTPSTSGYLMTSRIRFSTGDDKIFERVQVSAEGEHGTVDAIPYLNGVTASTYPTATLTVGAGIDQAEARIPDSFAGKKTTHIQLQLDLARSGGTSGEGFGMKLRGYVLKALPGQKRQRVERIPLMCFDIEKDQSGGRRGEIGTAWSRLRALEALEEAGGVLTLQRFGPTFTSADDQSVVIDDIEFIQNGAPNKTNGWGGVILLTVRTVD